MTKLCLKSIICHCLQTKIIGSLPIPLNSSLANPSHSPDKSQHLVFGHAMLTGCDSNICSIARRASSTPDSYLVQILACSLGSNTPFQYSHRNLSIYVIAVQDFFMPHGHILCLCFSNSMTLTDHVTLFATI